MRFSHDTRIEGVSYSAGDEVPQRYEKLVSDLVSPNLGQTQVPHIYTFSGYYSNLAKAYRNADEAVRDSETNANRMRLDPMIMGPLFARQMATALLDWSIEAEDQKDPEQKAVADELTELVDAIPRFTEMMRNLLEAIFFGRSAVQFRWQTEKRKGKVYRKIANWIPVHGDKLVFRYDDGAMQYDPDEVGVRVSQALSMKVGLREWDITYTSEGPATFLRGDDRRRMAVHKHFIMDGSFIDSMQAGMIHGVGVRHFLYWIWFQKQETLAQLAEVVEKTAMGFTVYFYPSGNDAAKAKMMEVAKNQNQNNQVFLPFDAGNPDAYRIEQIPGNTAGIGALSQLLDNYFGDWIIRFILGQTLSMRADATGLGSGLADLHKESFLNVIRYDAMNLEETITSEMLKPLIEYNFPRFKDVRFKFKINTEKANVAETLQSMQAMWSMGAKISAADAMRAAGLAIPGKDDEVLVNPQFAALEQQQQQQEAMAQQATQQASPMDELQAKYGPMMQAKRYSKTGDKMREVLERLPINCAVVDGETVLADTNRYRYYKTDSEIHLAGDKHSAWVDKDLRVKMTKGDYLKVDRLDLRRLQEAARMLFSAPGAEQYAEPTNVENPNVPTPVDRGMSVGMNEVDPQQYALTAKANPLAPVLLGGGNAATPGVGKGLATLGGLAVGAGATMLNRSKQASQPAEIGIPVKMAKEHDPNELLEKAISHFGITDVPELAGYVLPDGRMLNLSTDGKYRDRDHRDVFKIYGADTPFPADEDSLSPNASRNMLHFMGTSNAMRWMPEGAGVHLASMPTKRQRKFIAQMAHERPDEFTWDVSDHKTGERVATGRDVHSLWEALDENPWSHTFDKQKWIGDYAKAEQYAELEPAGPMPPRWGAEAFTPPAIPAKADPTETVTPQPKPEIPEVPVADMPRHDIQEDVAPAEPESVPDAEAPTAPGAETPSEKPPEEPPQDLDTAATDPNVIKPGEQGWRTWSRLVHLLPEGYTIGNWERVRKDDGSMAWQQFAVKGGPPTNEATDDQMRAALVAPVESGGKNDLNINRTPEMMDSMRDQIQMQRSLTNRKQRFAEKWGIPGFSYHDDPSPEDMEKLNGFVLGFAKKHGFDSSKYPTMSHAVDDSLNFVEQQTDRFGDVIKEAQKHGFKPTGEFATDAAGAMKHIMDAAVARGYVVDPKKEFVDQVEDASRHVLQSQADEKSRDWVGNLVSSFGGVKGITTLAMLLAALYTFHQLTRKR